MPEHYIHEVIESGKIQLFYVPTDQPFADIFTKNLGKTKFQDGRCYNQYLSFNGLSTFSLVHLILSRHIILSSYYKVHYLLSIFS